MHALKWAGQALGHPVVDDREAVGLPVLALPAHGRRTARGRDGAGALPGVISLELINVGRESPGRLDRMLQALEEPRLLGEAIEGEGEAARVEGVEGQAIDPVADGLG